MATVNYTIRLDEADKQAAEQVFSQLGLTLAAGLNVYLKAVARQQRIPFELALNEQTKKTHDTISTTKTIDDSTNVKPLKQHAQIWKKFLNEIKECDEQLGEEFDLAMNKRVNFTRELDL